LDVSAEHSPGGGQICNAADIAFSKHESGSRNQRRQRRQGSPCAGDNEKEESPWTQPRQLLLICVKRHGPPLRDTE
jgi:hypothetical protein